MSQALPGQVLGGRFRLESVLGEGGMGSVYAATDLSISRHVAVKVLRRELADDPIALERMREEAVSLASLRHPNVVQLYAFYASTPETTFIVMELVEGESLSRRLARGGPLPVPIAVDHARRILSALSAAHGKGIVHRDIKPANVLVSSVPMQRDLVKVLDFGIAKLTEETIRRKPTTAGMLLGTPSFMSPEQASGGLPAQRFQSALELVQAIDWASTEGPATAQNQPRPPVAITPLAPTPSAPPLAEPTLATQRTAATMATTSTVGPTGTRRAARSKAPTWLVVLVVALSILATVLLATIGAVTFLVARFVSIMDDYARRAAVLRVPTP